MYFYILFLMESNLLMLLDTRVFLSCEAKEDEGGSLI